MINRRDFVSALGAAVAAPFSSAQSSGNRPNLLFLYADDLGWGDVPFNGRKDWETPNLDRLAREGTVFTRWYTGSPLCAPSRGCLMTGRYTIHHTVRNNSIDIPKSETTIAEAVKPLGYKTALIGKWHQGRLPGGGFTHPLDQGFDQTFGYLDARHAWEHFPKQLYRGRNLEDVKGYSCDILADEAGKFLDANRNNNFYLYVPFIEPHFLIEAPPENVNKYKGKFREKNAADPLNATYAAMINRLDGAIGKILGHLDRLNLASNTLVIFTADNGATFEVGNKGTSYYHDSNRPFRGQKRSLEEGGIREPAVVRWPGRVPAGKRSDAVIHMTDVMPTFVTAAGGTIDPAWQVDGRNMLDVWTGKAPAPDRTLFWEFQTEGIHQHAAMRGDWKLLEIGGDRFLYNVKDDPSERRTLAPEYPDIAKNLAAELKAWLATEVKPAV